MKHLRNEWNIADIITSRNKGIFPFPNYLVIPNVYWGFDLNHECDLLIVSKSMILYEVEIKTSLSDLKNEFNKRKYNLYSVRNQNKIKYKYFAMPDDMIEKAIEIIPEDNGLISIDLNRCKASKIRKSIKNKDSIKLTKEDYDKLLRLAAMRYWSSRHKLFYSNL